MLGTGLRYVEGVTTLEFAPDRCDGCGRCIDVCPHAVFAHDGAAPTGSSGGDAVVALADKDACIECGACVKNCPNGALKVRPGVGCASAIILGWFTGSEPTCGCDSAC